MPADVGSPLGSTGKNAVGSTMVAVGGQAGQNGTADQPKLKASWTARGTKMPASIPTCIVSRSVAGIIHELATTRESAAASIAPMPAAPSGAAIARAAYTASTTRLASSERPRHQMTLAHHARPSGTPSESRARFPMRASALATVAATSESMTGISSTYQ